MAASGSVSIQGTVNDLPSGSKTLGPITQTSAAAVDASTQLELQSGDNTITIPTAAEFVIIVFDPTSATTKKLKGNAGDTGIRVDPAGSVLLPLDATHPTLIINSSATDTGLTTTVIFV